MTIFASTADTSKNAASSAPRFADASSVLNAAGTVVADISVRLIAMIPLQRRDVIDALLEQKAFTAVSEAAFSEEWDSPEDAIYDEL